MKINKIFIFILFMASLYGCKKDLGNYTYHVPADPTVYTLDGRTFPAIEGDSLILKPLVVYPGGNIYTDLTYTWEVTYSDSLRTDVYTGYPLRMVYNLPPGIRPVRLTVTVKSTGIKYFYNFYIGGITQYSKGTTVLSVQNGVTKLSFVLPGNQTVQSDIYQTINKETLPDNPIALYPVHLPFYLSDKTVQRYWVLCDNPEHQSVIVNGATLQKQSGFGGQFLSAPSTIIPGRFEDSTGIVSNGVVNGKLYIGVTSTAYFAPDFGKYGNPQPGNYTLSPFFTQTNNYFFGFDPNAQAFISFDGGGSYNGSDYSIDDITYGNKFDPAHMGMSNLLFMQAVSGTSYAFFKDNDSNIWEYSFVLSMDDYNNRTISPVYKRAFVGASFVQSDTKWQKSQLDVFYFTSGSTIYRFNPINQQLKALNANLGGKKVTMIKLSPDGKTLMAGVDGSIYYLDISVGKDGSTFSEPTINGLPGTPVDAVTQN